MLARDVRRSRRLGVIAGLLTTVLLLTACSDDGSGAGPPEPGADAIATLVQNGLAQLSAGQDTVARTTFENVLELDAENLYALYNLGYIAQDDGDTSAATDYYQRALAQQGDYVPALFNLAILLETTDLDRSVELYRQVLELDEQMAAAHMRLGFALVHLGQTEEGEDHLTRGIALDPAMERIDAPRYD